jgi:hypothetical protein
MPDYGFAVVAADDKVVWGMGKTKASAMKDALRWIQDFRRGNKETVNYGKLQLKPISLKEARAIELGAMKWPIDMKEAMGYTKRRKELQKIVKKMGLNS